MYGVTESRGQGEFEMKHHLMQLQNMAFVSEWVSFHDVTLLGKFIQFV